jgi:hypothetical protein
VSNGTVTTTCNAGATALGRAVVSSGKISQIKIWEPGSNYATSVATVTDPNSTLAVSLLPRVGTGVLGNPTFVNRGVGYRSSTTVATVQGTGYADIYQNSKFLSVTGLSVLPTPGAALTFGAGASSIYRIVVITDLSNGKALFQISPPLNNLNAPEHASGIFIRQKYSQCRITGHDFLDIGTGNFEETNYPELYSGFYTPAPENEVVELNRGRVFYTSTDQSGNFRAGELFAVEQSTGIVTISADFFDLAGLSELRLGGIRVGGTGAVIREFSTDPLFVADSNNIVPTQRAIAAYLAGRLSVGGSEIAVGSFIAGTILVGPDRINNTAGLRIIVPVRADFDAAASGISGSMLAQTMFYKSF